MNASKPALREIGRIVRPHGVRGELKVAPETDDPDRFLDLKRIFVGSTVESATSFDIVSVRNQSSRHGQTIILKLDGISDRTEAEQIGKKSVYADEEDLPPLEEGEFFYDQLIDLDVDDGTGTVVGKVSDVLEMPGQDRLEVLKSTGERVLVPLVDDLIEEVDFDNGILRVVYLDGLL